MQVDQDVEGVHEYLLFAYTCSKAQFAHVV